VRVNLRSAFFGLVMVAAAAFTAPAQDLRIAAYNLERLGQDHKDYGTLAGVIGRNDIVAAEEVMNEQGMREVDAKLGNGWKYAISDHAEGSRRYKEYFGFFYNSKVELVKRLGAFPARRRFLRPPYGVQFRLKETGFTFNLVAVHIVYGTRESARVAEINHLGEVHRYFERITGNAGMTIIAGDFNEERIKDFESLIDLGDSDVVPVKGTTIGMRGPGHGYDHIFVSSRLRSLVKSADVDYWTDDFSGSRRNVSDHFPVYCVIGPLSATKLLK
jgi:endonuclease/exonuclease/phosphatase family metal-dependent hydrolase